MAISITKLQSSYDSYIIKKKEEYKKEKQEHLKKEEEKLELLEKEKQETNTDKKKLILLSIKRLVWNTNIGEDIGKFKCMCCNSTDITQMNFKCGHIISEANGGEMIVSNLKPICQYCNLSMGTKNMDEFIKSLK
jgi:5-methylcytosine-specific restriction endonuclease McrA